MPPPYRVEQEGAERAFPRILAPSSAPFTQVLGQPDLLGSLFLNVEINFLQMIRRLSALPSFGSRSGLPHPLLHK